MFEELFNMSAWVSPGGCNLQRYDRQDVSESACGLELSFWRQASGGGLDMSNQALQTLGCYDICRKLLQDLRVGSTLDPYFTF